MNVLIDINHPGQVHLFIPIAQRLIREGGNVLLTARDKDVTRNLLESGTLPYVICSSRKGGVLSLLLELATKTHGIIRQGKLFKPDVILSLGSPPAAWASRWLGIPHIALEDTEHSTEQSLLYLPFTKYVLTSTAFRRNLGKKQIRYKGFHELAYLHPQKFTPDKKVIEPLGLSSDRPYSVVRFVSWQASHDMGHQGISFEDKEILIERLSVYGNVVLTSEAPLPSALLAKCTNIPPNTVHHVLAFARLYVGEGATMASEAAMLGVPAIYTNTLSAGTLEEQERYGLLHREVNFSSILKLAGQLMQAPDTAMTYQQRRQRMLSDVEDLTDIIHSTLVRAVSTGKL